MKFDLMDLGYDKEDIFNMSPKEANEILKNRIRKNKD